jgi:hypothetical protein
MKTLIYLHTLVALSAAPATASTWDASTSLAQFDQRVAGGLPQANVPIHATDEAGAATTARLDVASRLNTVVELPDGSAMLTYEGHWDGTPALISRGNGQLLIETNDTAQAVSLFDAAISTGLPRHVHLADTAVTTAITNDGGDDLVVLGALGGDIVFANGIHGQMYDATWHGESVVATRSGDHLDITSLSPAGVDITGFTSGSDDIEHESLPVESTTGAASVALNAVPTTPSRTRRSADIDLTPNRLTFHLMLHDDMGDLSSQHVHAGYVAWWLADLQRRIVPGKKVDLFYSQRIPGVTNMRYQYTGSLHDWSDVIENYAREQHIPRTYKHKFMLVVKGMPEPERYGRSWQKGSEGIASISGRYPEIAHQLGHLLDAKHADAEVRFGGWWCETNMYAPSLLLRSNCYGYSPANMRRIDDYVRTGDGFLPNSRWSED